MKLVKANTLWTVAGRKGYVQGYIVSGATADELARCKPGTTVRAWYEEGWNGRWDRSEVAIRTEDGWSIQTSCDYHGMEVLHKGDCWWRDVILPVGLPQSYWSRPHHHAWTSDAGYFDEVTSISSLELEKLISCVVNYGGKHEVQIAFA